MSPVGEANAVERLGQRLLDVPTLTGTPPDWDGGSDPVDRFARWLLDAHDHQALEPYALTLSTVDAEGAPDARILILKGIRPDGAWAFAGGASSSKGIQLQHHPVAALTFHWKERLRSVRIRGRVQPADPQESNADFASRSPASRAAALAGPTSQPLADPAQQADAVAAALSGLEKGETPEHDWTLWWLLADQVEFWQGSPDRQHHRERYTRTGTGWDRQLLWA